MFFFRNERVFLAKVKKSQSGDKSLKWAHSYKIKILQDHSFEKRIYPEEYRQ